MDFYEELIDMSDEEIDKYLSYEIYNLEKRSKKNNEDSNVLGYNTSYNPTDCGLLSGNDNDEFLLNFRCYYAGYVPKGIKVVYGLAIEPSGSFTNDGMYYIVDDDSYIYDFCKHIKNVEITTEGDLFRHIVSFLKNYFGTFKERDRDEMFRMVLMKDGKMFYDPVNEHKFSDFERKGNAMCSEYAIMANNILSVFGFDSYVVMGEVKDNSVMGGHAFNFVSYLSYTKDECKRIDALMDFFNSIDLYDFKFNKIGSCPFIYELDELNDDFVDDFINNERHIVTHKYNEMIIGNSLFELVSDKTREYFIKTEYEVNIMSNERQKCKSK